MIHSRGAHTALRRAVSLVNELLVSLRLCDRSVSIEANDERQWREWRVVVVVIIIVESCVAA